MTTYDDTRTAGENIATVIRGYHSGMLSGSPAGASYPGVPTILEVADALGIDAGKTMTEREWVEICDYCHTRYEYREESGHTEELSATTWDEAIEGAEAILEHGEWGQHDHDFRGCCPTANVEYIVRGEVVESRGVKVEIQPVEPGCDESDAHDWRANPDDGCSENPGVWSRGGTAIAITEYCLHCGMRCEQHLTGIQRNPGESDTTTYTENEDWDDNDGSGIAAICAHYAVDA